MAKKISKKTVLLGCIVGLSVILVYFCVNLFLSITEYRFYNLLPSKIFAREMFPVLKEHQPATISKHESGESVPPSSSTDYFRVLHDHPDWCTGTDCAITLDMFSCGVVPTARSWEQFQPRNNYWTIISEIPSNAPANLIVMVSANVDAASLRTRLGPDDYGKELRMKSSSWSWGTLYVVIYANGTGTHHRFGGVSSQLQNVYMSREYGPFDLTTNQSEQLYYLTPSGVVFPDND